MRDAKTWMVLIQTIVIGGGVVYAARQVAVTAEQATISAYQLRAAADASSAAMLIQLETSSRQLQLEVLADADLTPLLLPTGSAITGDQKRAVVGAMVINHYALAFDLHRLGQIGDSTWRAYVADMLGFFGGQEAQDRWDQIKDAHGTEFRAFVEHELLRRTLAP